VDGLKAAYHAVYRWLVAYKKPCVVGMILHHVMKQGFPRLEELVAAWQLAHQQRR
jgi:hypothetical protein